MRSFARLVPVALAAVVLVGCGRGSMPTAAKATSASKAAAKAVAPDDAKILAEDTRRAQYWDGDAVRVMAVHTTLLGSSTIAASANVFVSEPRYRDSKPCVFVARHYGFAAVAQYTQLPDYNALAMGLPPLPATTAVTSKGALDLAKTFTPAQPPQQPGGQPANGTEASKIFAATRAILVGNGQGAEWRLYGDGQRYVIDATTKQVTPPTAQVDPNDRLNRGGDVELQRASAVFLPTNPIQANIQKEPTASN